MSRSTRLLVAFLLLLHGADTHAVGQVEVSSSSDEPLWLNLQPLGQGETPPTQVAVSHDAEDLIVQFNCVEPTPDQIVTEVMADGGEVWRDDSVEVFADVRGDATSYFHIVVNSRGFTYQEYRDGQVHPVSLNPRVEAGRTEDGWSVKLRLPLDRLMLKGTAETWGMNFTRHRPQASSKTGQANQVVYQGVHHKPQTWAKFHFPKLDLSKASDEQTPRPTQVDLHVYESAKLEQLAEPLQWIRTEKLRVYHGWPVRAVPNREHYQAEGLLPRDRVERYFELMANAGFNVVATGAGDPKRDPFAFYHGVLTVAHARLEGMRVLWLLDGYPWPLFAEQRGVPEHLQKYADMVIATGQVIPYPSPTNAAFWNDQIADRIHRYLDWEDQQQLAGLTCGVSFDVESLDLRLCFNDRNWRAYLEARNINAEPLLPADQRERFLLETRRLDDYRRWQANEVARIMADIRRSIHERRPNYLILFYPYEWRNRNPISLGLAKGLSTAQRPALLWNDDAYFTGYTGGAQTLHAGMDFTRQWLGYEPLLLPSTDYVTGPKYPTYTPERLERETYLLTAAFAGNVTYGEAYYGRVKLWESHEPFWEPLKMANRRLFDEGIIEHWPKPLEGPWRTRLESLNRDISNQAEADWMHRWGLATDVSDPPQQQREAGGRIVLTKTLDGRNTPRGAADVISSASGTTYQFQLDQPQTIRAIRLNAWTHVPDGTVILHVNGNRLAQQPLPRGNDAQLVIWDDLDLQLTAGPVNVSVAFFDGPSFSEGWIESRMELRKIEITLTEATDP